jgi:heptose I phosphotransferase
MEPAAAGERVLSDGSRESFLMTLCLDGYLPADQYIKEYLAAPSTAAVRRAKHKLGRSLADLAARMHAHGFHHRDFYLCHIFVREHAAKEPDIKLIDLERAGRHSLMRQRWAVKDLAQIHYSSLAVPVTDWDRLRFFARYCAGIRRERRHGMLRRILRKSRAIARHDARLRNLLAPAADPFAVATIKSSDSNPPNTAP